MLPGLKEQVSGMSSFGPIYDRAASLKGAEALAASLPVCKTADELKQVSDDEYLREMTRCVFRSGFVWQVVDNKWPGFETAFMCFVPRAVAHLSDEALAEIAQDTAVIQNHQKINATRDNASLVLSVAEQHGSLGAFLADWPDDDVVGLQQYLKKAGSRLGGHTGQYFLRFSGKDTFMFSKDVVRVLIEQGVVDREPTSKKGLSAAQAAFNDWREETGLAFCKLSQIMAWSVG